MPVYQITAPDGKKLRITAPEGATQEDVLAYAQQNYAQPQADFSDVSATVTKTRKPTIYDKAPTPAMAGQVAMLDGLQHHLGNLAVGAGQLVHHGANALTQKLAGGTQFAKRSQALIDKEDADARQREADYQRRTDTNTATKVGSTVGGAAGEVLPWMVGMGELRAAGALPKLARVGDVAGAGAKVRNVAAKTGLLAAEGGAMGAVQPVTGEGSYGAQKAMQVGVGAVAAPVLAGTTAGAGKALALRDYLTKAGRGRIAEGRLAKLYGTDPQTLAALRQQGPIPGFTPTPAQALRTPEAIQTERILRNNSETAPAFARAEAANNAAMRGVGADIAQEANPAALAQAQAARRAATQPYYDQLQGQAVDPAPVLASLDALAASSMGVRPNIKSAAASLRSEIESRLDSGGKIDASILSGLRENIGSHLGPIASAQEKKALGPLADSIAGAIDTAVPGYRNTMATYAQKSAPISDIRAGRELLDAIDSGGRDTLGNPTVDLAKIRAALKRDDKAKFKMSQQARQRLESLLEAAQQRSVTNNTIAASGPGTAADALRGGILSPMWQRIATQLGGGAGALTGGTLVGGPLGGLAGYLAGTSIASGANAANNAVLRQLGQRGASAPATADAIEAYLRRRQQPALPYMPANALLPYAQP